LDVVGQLGVWATGDGPLYLQLASALARAIQRGDLKHGTVLPPERPLAESLAVSRTTLCAALDELKRSGWLDSRRGSGTWVSGAPSTDTDSRALALARTGAMRPFTDVRRAPVDLTLDAPPALPLVREALAGLARLSLADLAPAHGYVAVGTPELRSAIAKRLTEEGVQTDETQVLVTTGAQQALSLLAAYYLRPGDPVAVEDPGFPNAFDVFRAAGAELVRVPVDEQGVDVDVLEKLCAARPARFVYVTPTHQSPTGAVLGAGRRRRLARIAERFRIPVLEDTALADIPLGDGPRPPHVAHYLPDGQVVVIGSMSKLFWGGLRIGWIRAPIGMLRNLVRLKLMADISTPLISQLLATALLEHTEHARALRREQYLPRRDALTAALRRLLPEWTFTEPAGGFTLWAQMPAGADSQAFASVAARHGVAIAPGRRLSPEERHTDCVRLSFMLEPGALVEGVEHLASAWDAWSEREQPRPVDMPRAVFA
jgi:DNA-binding transcriptional MocR family regulator